MENKTINLAVIAEVARALQNLKERIVFVGGAVVSLYTDDPAADEIRPTADIDLTINLVNVSDWSRLQEDLVSLGFYPDPFGHSIVSYKYNNIPIDIMPAEDSPKQNLKHFLTEEKTIGQVMILKMYFILLITEQL
jgi:hypothetical protein